MGATQHLPGPRPDRPAGSDQTARSDRAEGPTHERHRRAPAHHEASTEDNQPRTLPGSTVDTLFGEIAVRLDGQDRLTVEGEQIPTVVLERDPASETDPLIAIGTRDPAALTMSVGGTEAEITPAKGKLRRQTYRIDVEHDGAHYQLEPDSVPSSRLTRDGTHLGDFSSDGDETVIAEWRESAEVHPADAAVGYAPVWMMLVDYYGLMCRSSLCENHRTRP
ncbi:hypothetical protein ACH4SP_14890 [Streptomyces sp. NPDC021093]|uniref:hypothetical protein n=1 Tax=Streptomyces sp. NPDC021093 TaxID=3365112 RepID=UPI00379CF6B0